MISMLFWVITKHCTCSNAKIIKWYLNSHYGLILKSCSLQWRPSFWCMLQSGRANHLCETLERANCPTSKMSRPRFPPPHSHPLPHPHLTPFSPESHPPCTSPPTCLQTRRSFSVLQVCLTPKSQRYQFSIFSTVLLQKKDTVKGAVTNIH